MIQKLMYGRTSIKNIYCRGKIIITVLLKVLVIGAYANHIEKVRTIKSK